MKTSHSKTSDYDRIAKAISFIAERVNDQPTLGDIAAHLHMSPFHFQRVFSRWAGVTPKRFLQVLTLERGKHLLGESQTLLQASDSLGLSSGSRLYDHFVQLESVTPGEFKKLGRGLCIEYGAHHTPFGLIFIAITTRGVCRAAFLDQENLDEPLVDLQTAWPYATLRENQEATRAVVEAMFGGIRGLAHPLSLYVSGTNFQVAVWKALLRVPSGTMASYSQIAAAIGHPRSARAIGSAMAANPIAFLIPCHRVIRRSGALGGYRWNETRKQAIQIWEAARLEGDAS